MRAGRALRQPLGLTGRMTDWTHADRPDAPPTPISGILPSGRAKRPIRFRKKNAAAANSRCRWQPPTSPASGTRAI
ncbi:Uncharacterised protein [Burkholderia oklahomensis]|nr:hypothetical protein BG90_3665 [Burkholderia oklahomensis C6786]SUW54894.1 Uncharacterised protein [Burkholderia oklahomensis]